MIEMELDDFLARIGPSLQVNPPVAESNGKVKAATLILLADNGGEAAMGLIRRAAGADPHSGQVSFPGGRLEGDETPLAAALRETEEEIGVAAEHVEVAGFLPVARTVVTGFLVWPVIGVLKPPVEIRPAPEEVAEFFWAPLSFFADPANMTDEGARPVFRYEGKEIWGITLRIIDDLLELA